MSGGIARDRSTTPQRSSQGSQTAAGRKRSPRERADLDGENDVVAWVDTAGPPVHADLHQFSRGPDRKEAQANGSLTVDQLGRQLFGAEFVLV